MQVHELGPVVELGRVWNRDELLGADVHEIGLVVVDLIGDVMASLRREVVEGVPSFGQPGPASQPTGLFPVATSMVPSVS